MWRDGLEQQWLEFIRQERLASLDMSDRAALASFEADFCGVGWGRVQLRPRGSNEKHGGDGKVGRKAGRDEGSGLAADHLPRLRSAQLHGGERQRQDDLRSKVLRKRAPIRRRARVA